MFSSVLTDRTTSLLERLTKMKKHEGTVNAALIVPKLIESILKA